MQVLKLATVAAVATMLYACSKEPATVQAPASQPIAAPKTSETPSCDAPKGMDNVKELIAAKLVLSEAAESRARLAGVLGNQVPLKQRWLDEKEDVVSAMKMDLVVTERIDNSIGKRWCKARVTIPKNTDFPLTVNYSFQLSPTDGTVTELTFDNGITGAEGFNVAISYLDALLGIVLASEFRSMQKSATR